MMYVAWFLVEGLLTAFEHISLLSLRNTSGAFGIENSITLCVGSVLAVMFLHSSIGGETVRCGFRVTTFLHQLVIIVLSLWKIWINSATELMTWSAFRAIILSCCIIIEALLIEYR